MMAFWHSLAQRQVDVAFDEQYSSDSICKKLTMFALHHNLQQTGQS